MSQLLGHSTGTMQPLSDSRRMLQLTTPHMQGPDVETVQRKLGIKCCGKYGPDTKAAVMEFQRKKGLAVDGIVGPNTWAALDRVTTAPAKVENALGPASIIGTLKALPSLAVAGWNCLSTTEKWLYGVGGTALTAGVGIAIRNRGKS